MLQFAADISTNVPGDPLVSPTIAILLFCIIFLLNTFSLIIENLNTAEVQEIGKSRDIATVQE